MTFPYVTAINMIPASGEFVYDSVAYDARQPGATVFKSANQIANPSGSKTDLQISLDQLQTLLPNCKTVALVVQWLGNSMDASQCKVYPSSTFIFNGMVGAFRRSDGTPDSWRVSDLVLTSPLIPISRDAYGNSAYGGVPSDQSVVRCIQEIKSRGLKVALYLQMNMDVPGQPWRGLVTYSNDVSSAASAAVASFLGSATTGMFTRDAANLTAHYSGSLTDFSYRRFALHYANLAVLAGGVNLFVVGSELRGLEGIRGPSWTPVGTVDANGKATWDYPFVDGMITLCNDVRSIFDGAGLTKNLATRQNLVTYSADWSQWTGVTHSGTGYSGIWPHLDKLYSATNVDFISFDNYIPLSDWTTGDGGVDARNWRLPAPAAGTWPIADPSSIGFGLKTAPDIHDIDYLKANIEGGEKFYYFYRNYDTTNKLDPNGTNQIVTAPQGDRLSQSRSRFYPGQELFAFKNLRWFWNNTHRAVYDNGDGTGTAPHGPVTAWVPNSKSIIFLEYGFPSIDSCTNEDNLFYNPNSVAGGSPFWCTFTPSGAPKSDFLLQSQALTAFNQYWTTDGKNATVGGVPMIATDLMFAWTWDARPFPAFPLRTDVWSDGSNWIAGHWLTGKYDVPIPPAPSSPPSPGSYPTFPALRGQGWSSVIKPRFDSRVAELASGKTVRSARMRYPVYEIELTYNMLRSDPINAELQTLAGFFKAVGGRANPFWVAPPDLANMTNVQIGTGDGTTTAFQLLWVAGAYSEPLAGVSGAGAIAQVTVNSVPISIGQWSLSSIYNPCIVFSTPPAAGAIVKATYSGLWLCRFQDEVLDFNQFMYQMHELSSLKLQTVKTYGDTPSVLGG